MQSFVAYLILSSLYVTLTSSQDVIWEDLHGYTCKDLLPAISIFYNISLTECHTKCFSPTPAPTVPTPKPTKVPSNTDDTPFPTIHPTKEPTQPPIDPTNPCTATVWYEFVKNTGNDVPRCYLFGQSCELMTDPTKPVTTSFWYNDVANDLHCVDYPSNWKDNFFDNCDAYSAWDWCDYAYNSSTTAILSYQDTIYGFDALKVCCECNGGLFDYDNTYLFEPKWKPTSKLNIYQNTDDFICRPLDFTSELMNDADILDEDKFTLSQFIGLCQQLHASLYNKYRLLLSINTDNNNIINSHDIDIDFMRFASFDCVESLLLNNVTICDETDYNNLYPFIIDLEANHIYINNHYINAETFLYHLPPTNINIKSFCTFSVLLETIYPTESPTKRPSMNPTKGPSMEPTEDPTSEPTPPSSSPTMDPTVDPTTEPTSEPTLNPSVNPTTEPTADPTSIPTRNPTNEPTTEPTADPTIEPTAEPTPPTSDPTKVPTMEPTLTPVGGRRRLLADYFTSNVIAVFLCDTRFTTDPTEHPTLSPITAAPTTPMAITTVETISNNNDTSSGGISSTAYVIILIIVGILFIGCLLGGLLYYYKYRESESPAHKGAKPKAPVQKPDVDIPQPPPAPDGFKYSGFNVDNTGAKAVPKVPMFEDIIDDDADGPWRYKRMRDWTNDDILDWVRSMKLGAQGSNKILNEIQGNGCIGDDICALKSAQDVGDAFDMTDAVLCGKIYSAIQNFKPRGKGKGNDRFRINLFSLGADVMLDQEVTKTDTVAFIKSLFKIQMQIDVDVEYIHFKYKNKELSSGKTLKQCGIKDSNHLITVVMDDVFAININAQGNNMVLNKKVTKQCSIRQLKQMYKSQSGVRSGIDDIHFKYKNKELQPMKTLSQVGIVDERHLISVTFGADGGS